MGEVSADGENYANKESDQEDNDSDKETENDDKDSNKDDDDSDKEETGSENTNKKPDKGEEVSIKVECDVDMEYDLPSEVKEEVSDDEMQFLVKKGEFSGDNTSIIVRISTSCINLYTVLLNGYSSPTNYSIRNKTYVIFTGLIKGSGEVDGLAPGA